uniref:Uncharacterized protein n=1 Tax=Xenopus tropicalis TaxID=8364 RepID=A0A1B8Y7Y5_XENTR
MGSFPHQKCTNKSLATCILLINVGGGGSLSTVIQVCPQDHHASDCWAYFYGIPRGPEMCTYSPSFLALALYVC